MKATVFLGGGRITTALLAGLRLAGYDKPIVVHDRNPGKLRQLRRQYRVVTELNLPRAVAQAGVLILAVRPDSVSDVLLDLRDKIKVLVVGVSLAAGIPLAQLRKKLPISWVRAMPSPVCRSGRGLTALTFANDYPAASRKQVREFFRRVGAVLEIPESRFDAFTVTYSSSHGYHALATLSSAAQKLGLDRKTALAAAAHALADGILSWREGGLSLEELLQEAVTPGGIAAAVTSTMDRRNYRQAVEAGLRAGLARARANARR
ncbi:MAG TPA: NAD(P)-binding domain-containing protein [Terriglobales bacterium]|nr:NAD(P)-binding domain-containing protein [Terriglobales bacterium]